MHIKDSTKRMARLALINLKHLLDAAHKKQPNKPEQKALIAMIDDALEDLRERPVLEGVRQMTRYPNRAPELVLCAHGVPLKIRPCKLCDHDRMAVGVRIRKAGGMRKRRKGNA